MNTHAGTPTPHPAHPVVMVDDEPHALRSYEMILLSQGITHVRSFTRAEEARAFLADHPVELILLDLWMPGLSGQELLAKLYRTRPEIPVIILTAASDAATAVDCMKQGALDYLTKPVEAAALLTAVRRAMEVADLRRENTALNARFLDPTVTRPDLFADLITGDPAMKAVFRYIESIAASAHPVLITGETGVGKERVARALHRAGGRTGEFVAVNAAGLDTTVLSDTLFGHKRGAYTGADRERPGLVARANGGILFLDEIGDLPAESQVKLLRLIQEREYYALGSDRPQTTDARIVVATNKPFTDLQNAERFRPDLFYRLRAHHIHVPPLRERRGDIPLLADHFARQYAAERHQPAPRLSPEFVAHLCTHAFPGNVRELQAVMLDAVTRAAGGDIRVDHAGAMIPGTATAPAASVDSAGPNPVMPTPILTLKDAEKRLIDDAVRAAGGNLSKAATLLGISRPRLYRKLGKKEDEILTISQFPATRKTRK